MTILQRPLLIGSALSVAVLTSLAAAPALADSQGDVSVTNTESVQVYLSPDGKIDTKRVYEQLQMTGKGSVDLRNPISTDHLRNLDGFSGFDVQDGAQVVKQDVDGQVALRSVSDYNGDLPLRVSVAYKLDGKTVEPGDVVGADGRLEVLYTVENVTGAPQQLSFDDGHGQMVTRTVEVPIPMVASLVTTAPASFDNVTSESASMGGDGHGGTQMNFTMTLFPPIGSTKATVGYTADIHDGVVPRAELSGLPVNPLESPVFKTAATSYQGGATSGIELTDGSTQIDTNLLRLRDGAAKLVAGLIKLDDGAAQLRDGLADKAAPGAAKLADGTVRLDDGLGKLSDGAGRLADGTGKASAGSQRLASGSKRLSGGVGQLSGGVGQLSDGQHALENGLTKLYDGVKALPASVQEQLAANPDYQSALLGLRLVIFNIGNASDAATAPTLLGGLNKVAQGMRWPNPADRDCAQALTGGTPTHCGALDMVDLVADQLRTAGSPLAAVLTGTTQQVDQQLLASGAGLDKLRMGLSNPNADPTMCAANIGNPALKCGVKEVNQALLAGIPTLVDLLTGSISQELLAGIGTPTKGCDPTSTLRCGAAALADGLDQVVDGVSKLQAGAMKLSAGAGELSDGLDRIDDGAGKLADGAQQAKDGSAQIADGAGQLSDGLRTAADGSGRLSDGLGQARGGAPKLVDGAQRLSDEGTKKLIAAGEDTAQSYGEMVAVLKAGAERATTDDMAFGAPDGAVGLTAYSYILEGASGEDQRNLMRGAAGGALLVAAAGVLAIRRRLV
jgi:putative membrane protein